MMIGKGKNNEQLHHEEDKESTIKTNAENHTKTSTLKRINSRIVTDAPLDDGSHIGLYNEINDTTRAVGFKKKEIKTHK
jgi:hypothetical protein